MSYFIIDKNIRGNSDSRFALFMKFNAAAAPRSQMQRKCQIIHTYRDLTLFTT